jgi:arylsulfatase A-like enzyme
VPLVVAGPGVTDQEPREEPVTILDLHATFLDRAGVDPGPVDSQSMVDTLAGGATPRDVVRSGLSSWRLAYDGRYKLIEGYDPAQRVGAEFEPMRIAPEHVARRRSEREAILHDLDVNEIQNRAADHPDVVERLHEVIETGIHPD